MPEFVEEVDQQATNVRTVIVLIGHNHHASIAQVRECLILLAGLKSQDLLQFCNLLGMFDLGIGCVLHVEDLTLERVDAIELALFLR